MTLAPARAQKPRLVVNIVVSQLRYDYLSRFGHNLPTGGIRRFADLGITFTDARYDYMHTSTPAGLATFTTGAEPSTHGIVADHWVDYTTGAKVDLVADENVYGLGCDAGRGQFSQRNIAVPTLGDRLLEYDPRSRVVAVAADPVSAVVMGGQNGEVFWLDESRGCWGSSTAYMEELPQWVVAYNDRRVAREWLGQPWRPLLDRERYANVAYSVMSVAGGNGLRRQAAENPFATRGVNRDYARLLTTPAGNIMVADFAKQVIENEGLGRDDHTDLLNICFDTPRLVGEMYGGESMEAEDLFYRMDREIAGLLDYLNGRLDMNRVVVVLTSDHGSSDSFDYGTTPRDRFNAAQFKVIINGFMNAQWGAGDWVVDYVDRQLYLNRNLIYQRGLSLEEVQNRVAAFALQFRGVSHVLTSTAMQTSYFGGSYARQMQNGFYPRRAGDLTLNLMPGWIEERDGVRASSGSMYEYDTHVPLMILGAKFFGQRVGRTVNMRDVAPTLALIMQISRPIAAEGTAIDEVAKVY
jgi:hypothetical protein